MKEVVKLPFGDRFVEIELPSEQILAVAEPRDVPSVLDEEAEVKEALDNPIGHEELEALARRRRRVVVLCDDFTRPTPVYKVMPILLNRLNEAGVEDRDVEVMIASGTHRPMTLEEVTKKLGKEVVDRVKVLNHEWRNLDLLASLGTTESGTPITVNKHVLKADVKIGIGSIVPHRVSGYSGGAKIVQPGVCGGDTTGYTHWLSAKFSGEEIMGVVENIVRREMESIAMKVGLDFIVNLVLNAKGGIVKVVAGDFVKAHRVGVEYSRKVHCVEVPSKAEIVVSDAYPNDMDLWQAAKGICASELVVRKGGTIVLIAPCQEGVSSEHPEVLRFGYRPYEEVKGLVELGLVKDLSAAAHMAHVGRVSAEKAKVILCSKGVSKDEASRLNLEYEEEPQKAIDRALARHGSKARIIVLRQAAKLLPIPSR